MNIQMLLTILSQVFQSREYIAKFFLPNKFLNHNPSFLLESYNNEPSILGKIPYREEICWIGNTWAQTREAVSGILVEKRSSPFVLEASTKEIKTFQVEALKERDLKRDSTVIRLNSMKRGGQKTSLTVQPAKYSDQAQSNLAMDWDDNHALKKVGINTLRSFFLQKYSKRLPPLSDNQFANTIGISVVLFYKNPEGNYVPYLPRRAKSRIDEKRQLAVFTGGEYHCTASGAAEWTDIESSFDGVFTHDMYREIKEEVEINQSEVKVMIPLALCREFLRGGKPQIFFAGITTLSQDEIAKRRKIAIAKQVKEGFKVEIQDEQLYLSSMEELSDQINKIPPTLEAWANCYYAAKFIEQYEGAHSSEDVSLMAPANQENASVREHPNIKTLIERMENALSREDYSDVIHSSASIFETLAKEVVGTPTVQEQTLKRFFDRYRKDSSLPSEILDYIIAIYESRNKTPLAGHGSTRPPQISREQAVSLCEMTKAFVRIEYKLRST